MKKLAGYLFGLLFFTLIITLTNCEKEEVYFDTEQKHVQIEPIVRTLTQDNAGVIFNQITHQLKVDKYLKKSRETNSSAKTSQDTLGITIYTDVIKEVTIGDYTSYTMSVASPNPDDSKFYNITLESKNGVPDVFMTKYVPTQNWLNNANSTFEGNISTHRSNDLTDVFDDNLNDESNDSNGDGAIGGFSTLEGSPYYPTDCQGIVNVMFIEVVYLCECADHLPGQCIDCNAPGYYAYVPYYFCQESDNPLAGTGQIDSTNNNSNTGSTNTDNTNNTSASVLIKPNDPTSVNEAFSSFLQSLDQSTQNFINNDLNIKNGVQSYWSNNDDSNLTVQIVNKGVGILNNETSFDTLDTIELKKGYPALIGSILTALNPGLFEEHEEAWEDVDPNNVLDITEWLLVLNKVNDVYFSYTTSALPGLTFDQNQAIIDSLFVSSYSTVKSSLDNNWPQNAEEWSALGNVMGQFLVEIGLAFIPGSDIIQVLDGIQEGSITAVVLGVAGLLVDAFGASILKAISKVGKAIYKSFSIFKIIYKYLDEVIQSISLGFKTNLVDDGVEMVNDFNVPVAHIVDDVLTFKYTGFGGDIVTNPNKTTTVLGKWIDPAGGGTKEIIESGLSKSGENLGGLNALDELVDGMSSLDIWNTVNKPWLEAAVSRGDIIRAVSDPNVLSNMTNPTNFNGLSFFGMEHDYLINIANYTYDAITKTYIP